MINPISANASIQSIATTTPKPPTTPPATQTPQDTVHLSPQAQAAAKASGDLDHDGDSH